MSAFLERALEWGEVRMKKNGRYDSQAIRFYGGCSDGPQLSV
jgi:hypothetical protein